MLLHPKKNIGRVVKINGQNQEISEVLASGDTFRIKSEENGPVVNDYKVADIQSALTLTVSLNEGLSWLTIPVEEAS